MENKIEELNKDIEKLLKQIEWCKQNYSINDIPEEELNYGLITRNEAQRIQAKNEKILLDEIKKLKEENKKKVINYEEFMKQHTKKTINQLEEKYKDREYSKVISQAVRSGAKDVRIQPEKKSSKDILPEEGLYEQFCKEQNKTGYPINYRAYKRWLKNVIKKEREEKEFHISEAKRMLDQVGETSRQVNEENDRLREENENLKKENERLKSDVLEILKNQGKPTTLFSYKNKEVESLKEEIKKLKDREKWGED